ncbi:dual specificity protein phosphatase CDC14B-like isoform X2 [Danaus plexippus]|uniref:dual specificity protein phosphatase CDC14B-like isoform X2 n=1 Tax=Danaus plexippus TaxID=13037 RepID=UPI002AB1E9FC|nr:dual specificity protein phosphatase CDC14B-like isoform X2 [Danaus plexippus]
MNTMARNSDILYMTEYIKNVLYFATVRPGKSLKNTEETHYFCIDNELIYENYYSDFGPLNLGCVYKYCKILNEKLKQYLNKQCIVHYTSMDPKKKANAAFLMGSYGVLYLSLPPKDALEPLLVHGQCYRPFQDATQGDSNYTITIMDCLQSLSRARDLGFFDFQDFNYQEYERLDKIQGDLNWIVPDKFLAFIGPVDYNHVSSLYHPPEIYVDYFKENNVQIVMRLNKKLYDSNVFINSGIMHYNLFFPDGSCPPRHILLKFLQISEECDGAIAVHCKAGLGRTGSLIGCYLIKHYRMTAHEAIAWMRICRPGSVIGHQQSWLEELEPWLIKQGNLYRRRMYQDMNRLPVHDYGIYSMTEKINRQRPVVLSKSPSPPPPFQRQNRNDVSTSSRPQASKIREAPGKTVESETSHLNEQLNIVKNVPLSKRVSREMSESRSRRSGGAGEPRTMRSSRNKTPSDNSVKNMGWCCPYRPSSPVPIETLSDARKLLMRSTLYNNEIREKKLDAAITVKPQISNKPSIIQRPVPGTVTKIAPTNLSQITRGSIQPSNRRRLGRSPSPPQMRIEHSRATNTPPTECFSTRDSKVALTEALSRLKLSAPQDRSVGASSLGARRDAPAGRRAPSVHSDERPFATQGDLLNSIKFQRRLRECFVVGKNLNERNSITTKEKPLVFKVNSRTIAGTKATVGQDISGSKDKPVTSVSRALHNQRPCSPKGRRSPHAPFY